MATTVRSTDMPTPSGYSEDHPSVGQHPAGTPHPGDPGERGRQARLALGPNPMGPCTGPLGCKLDHGDHATNATWCVSLGDVPPFAACDYHADLLKRTLDGLVRIEVAPIELLDELLDLDAAAALDTDPGDREPPMDDRLPEGSCVCHDSTMCPDAMAEMWAPGEYTEAYGR